MVYGLFDGQMKVEIAFSFFGLLAPTSVAQLNGIPPCGNSSVPAMEALFL